MKALDIAQLIDRFCPQALAEAWDHSGPQIILDRDVDTILVALELNEDVFREAEEKGAQMIVTHHPFYFSPLPAICEQEPLGALTLALIRAGISVFSAHTNFDAFPGGNNDYIAGLLGIANVRMLNESNPFCRRGELPREMEAGALMDMVATRLGLERASLRLVASGRKSFQSLAWCTGAGADFLEEAAAAEVDLYLTGDLKYHQARHAEELGLAVLDAGHFGTELCFVPNMAAQLKQALTVAGVADRVRVLPAQAPQDPFCYG